MRARPNYTVQRVGDAYLLTFSEPQEAARLYASVTPYDPDPVFQCEVAGESCRVPAPLPGRRIYFAVTAGGLPPVWAADRAVEIPSMDNFRDLGGYAAAEGKTVRWGRFFRSGAVHGLSEAERATLKHLRIAQIIDYRAEGEAAKAADEVPEGAAYSLAPAIDPSHATVQLADMNMNVCLRELHTVEDYAAVEALFDQLYRSLPFGNGAYRRMFDALDGDAGLPMLQHCSAGKDRTGVGCVLLLMALGVSREDAMRDYLLSASFRARSNADFVARFAKGGCSEAVLELVERMITVRPALLQEALDAIDARYPSFEAFLAGEYGADAARLARWRALHTV